MRKIFITAIIALCTYAAHACYADYTYNNGCVGDTVFFQALDGFAAYSWDYGDSSSGAANISHDAMGYHVYTAPGDYYVTLFVNVGAEWDYRTNIIHIGSNCFAADFKTTCSGNLNLLFSDNSTGIHNTQFWNFGDASSGTNDTTSGASPSHLFSAAGYYLITYIVSNNTISDTILNVIHVDSICLAAVLPNFTAALNCTSDTVNIQAGFSAGVTYISWNFGDPASGIADTSSMIQPSHQFSTPGFYIITVVYGDGVTFDTLTKGIPIIDCNVWPGDANGDGEVNGEDIFPLGVYNGSTGNQRNGASQSWSGQNCTSWSRTGYSWMYLQDLVDMKTADCNGDGIINSDDVQAIQANYGQHHSAHNNKSAILFHSLTDPLLSVSSSPSIINSGSDINVTVSLGSPSTPADHVYGGSFTLLFDPAKVDANALVTFSLGWLDSTGNSLITFYHMDYNAGRLELAYVKTNHISQSGYGNIATVTFHSKANASGVFDIGLDGTAKLFNTNQYNSSGGNQEVFKSMYLQGTSVSILNPNAVNTVNPTQFVSVSPNPSNGSLFVHHPKSDNEMLLQVFNNMGQKVFSKILAGGQETERIELSIANGLYMCLIKNESGEVIGNEKVAILK